MQLKQFYKIATKVSSRKKCYYFLWSTWLSSEATSQYKYNAAKPNSDLSSFYQVSYINRQ